jgi:haloalkane dehalogenase
MSCRRCNVHYVDEGDGPVLLLMHIARPTRSLSRLITGLRDGFRCIAIDFPGFGLSTRPGYRFTPAEHAGSSRSWFNSSTSPR